MNHRDKTISKFLSLVLRHHPEAIGVELDRNGWLSIDELLRNEEVRKRSIDRAALLRVVETNDKQRFAISADGKQIRANQGHSINVDLQLSSVVPDSRLFHGTVERFLSSIFETGLRPGKRDFVHLSPDHQTAVEVGKRRGKPVILVIDAIKMHSDGFEFFRSENGVWLTRSVPVDYLSKYRDGING